MAKSRIPVAVKSPATKNNDNQKSNKKNKKVTGGAGGDSGSKSKKNNSNQAPIMTAMMSEDSSSNDDKQTEMKSSLKKHSLKIDDQINEHDEWISPIQNYFIWLISAIYLFAFVSFYMQIRGLYGNKGVLPLRYFAVKYVDSNENASLDSINRAVPSLVWYLASTQGFSLTSSLELISIAGSLISFIQLLSNSFRTPIIYFLLFILYYSCVNVGQTFLYFQWDAFLLETGALTVLVSIRCTEYGSRSFLNRFRPYPPLVLWTVRWLLFKFMLSSGIVKFTSRCPLWWSLRSLDVHFESQPLPTPFAWYAHQIPQNWLHLAVVIHFVIEIAVPFMFFTPFRTLKLLSFYTQIFLQIMIALTGNYNFFNLLTMVLCLTLLDDDMFRRRRPQQTVQTESTMERNSMEICIFGAIIGMLAYYTVYYFDVMFHWNDLLNGPTTKVNFTYDQFNLFVIQTVTASIVLGIISLTCMALIALYKSISYGSITGRIVHLIMTMFYVIICASIMAISIVPLAELDTTGYHMKSTVPMEIRRWYQNAQHHHLVSSYGLFRVMTGDGGRPELIIEGSNDANAADGSVGDWRPYYFRYKPVDLYQSPAFVVPHQPRLDWQMWFAALDSYQNNPWLLNLCYRILTGESDVLNLLDTTRLPFDKPPKFLRISRYIYKYTDSLKYRAWWHKVTNRHAYLPMVTKETLESALKLVELKKQMSPALNMASRDRSWTELVQSLNWLHSFLVANNSWLTAPVIIYTLISFVAVINFLRSSSSSSKLKPK
uniref:Lipase maturation factor n=1 Tax=Dermatophagoides pteronyssinus TaxID=6956 RepID=A0A6P6YI33_DERPT|nr:lipase maturation factor 2-like [Dermatophagoides pteronyssinus]